MPIVALPSFAKGEISPTLYARVDTAMYKSALRTARNAIIHPYGGVSNRAGTVCIGPVKDHANSPRLFRFHLGVTDQYVLEFGNLYMRVIRNDAYVLNTATTITAATAANPVQITAAGHGFSTGDDVVIVSVGGMVELNAGTFTVANSLTNTVELTSQVTGEDIDGTTFTAYTSGGTIADIFELTTTYAQADLSTLKMVQTGNVLTITHPNYAPRDLTRTDHNAWTLTTLTFAPTLAAPATVSVSSDSNTNFTVFEERNQTVSYQVTAIESTDNFFEESLATTGTTTDSSDPPLNTITWASVTNANRYAIYRSDNGIFGLLGETEATATLSFVDDNLAADLIISPPRARSPFTSNAPATSGYYQQRQVYGGSDNNSDTNYFSQTGLRLNMSVSNPLQADDAITSGLSSQDVQIIRHYVPLDDLLIFTNAAEWRANSGGDSTFSFDTIKYTPQTTWGSDHPVPIVIGRTVLFVEDGGANIRAMGFSLSDDGYNSPPMTLLADHLLAEKSANEYIITDWAHQLFPEPRIYMVRSDGKMLTLTFNQEQEVIAWTVWDTDGEYESVTSLRRSLSSVEDGLYFVIKRTINGQTQRTVERMHTRKYVDVKDTFFLDLGAELNSPVAITSITSGSSGVILAAGHGLSDGDEVEISEIEWKKIVDSAGNETNPDIYNDTHFTVANSTADTFELLRRSWGSGRLIDIRSAFPETRFDLSDLTGEPKSMIVSDDGLKMFILDSGADTILEYDLTIAWDVATATHNSVTFDFSSITTDGRGMAFSDDNGTTIFLAGENSDNQSTIYQIDLSTGFDLSTASNGSKSTNISAQVSKMFDIDMDHCGAFVYVTSRIGKTSAIYQFTVSTLSDASTITYEDKKLFVTNDVTNLRSVFMRKDGTQMFVLDDIGADNVAVVEYELDTKYEVDTSTLKEESGAVVPITCGRSIVIQESDGIDIQNTGSVTHTYVGQSDGGSARYIKFRPNGEKVFEIDDQGKIFEHDLSTAWDLKTAAYNSKTIDISGTHGDIPGLTFKSDGLRAILIDQPNDRVESFTMSTAWDISTLTADGTTFSYSTQLTDCESIFVKDDGLKFFLMDNSSARLYQYSMSSAWDLSGASYDGVEILLSNLSGQTFPTDMEVNLDGTKLYLWGVNNNRLFEYDLSIEYDLTTLSYDGVFATATDLLSATDNPSELSIESVGFQFVNPDENPCVKRMFPITGRLADSKLQMNSTEIDEEPLDIRKMFMIRGCSLVIGSTTVQGSVHQLNIDKIVGDEGESLTIPSGTAEYFRGGEIRKAVNVVSGITGLHCLNNTEVCIMADGVLEADQTVVNNTITIADGRKVARAAIGICYTTDIETLDIEVTTPPNTIQGKKKKVTDVMTRYYKSAMPLIGPNSNDLVQTKRDEDVAYGTPTPLFSGDVNVNIPPSWNSNGRVFYRMKDPFPLTVLGVFPDITIEEDLD